MTHYVTVTVDRVLPHRGPEDGRAVTWDEALRKAQAALGCHVERDDSERGWCNHPDHSNCPPLWWHVTDVLLDVYREARAAALDEAAANAIRTDTAAQDAVLAVLVEAGRLVEVGGPLVCGWCGHLWTEHGDVWSWECRRSDCLCPEFSSHRECRLIEPGWREAP